MLPHPISYAQFCARLIKRFSSTPPPHSFPILPALVGLSQLDGDLKAYLDEFSALKEQLPYFSSREARSIFVNGLAPSVRAHVLGVPNVSTFERALEEARKLVNEQPKSAPEPAPEPRQTEKLLVCFHCGKPGHWAYICHEKLKGGLAEPPHVFRAVELCPDKEATEPSQLTSGFGAAAFGGILQGFPRPTMGVSLGQGFHVPTDAMPGIGLPVAGGPAYGE